MHLTTFSDYALRVLIYLAVNEGPGSLDGISKAYGISRNHLIKAVNVLKKNGFVETRRGVGGGIRLSREPERIGLADVVRCTEPSFTLVECFDRENNACRITPACKLKDVLGNALKAFMDELEAWTLADITDNRRQILKLLEAEG